MRHRFVSGRPLVQIRLGAPIFSIAYGLRCERFATKSVRTPSELNRNSLKVCDRGATTVPEAFS